MKAAAVALTPLEFDELRMFFEAQKERWPDHIRELVDRLLRLYQSLSGDKRKAADVLKTLRMAMGFLPTSERGAQDINEKR